VGIAFHPVVGLWTLLAVMGAAIAGWALRFGPLAPASGERVRVRGPNAPSHHRGQFSGIDPLRGAQPPHPVPLPRSGGEGARGKANTKKAIAVAILILTALPGLIPVVQLLTATVDPMTRYAGTYLQVYHRLAHHVDPMLFPLSGSLAYLGLGLLWLIGVRFGPRTTAWRWVHGVMLWAVIFAVAGVLVGYGPRPPQLMPGYAWRMHLLKFYPFRLGDALLPMVVAWLGAWSGVRLLSGPLAPVFGGEGTDRKSIAHRFPTRSGWRWAGTVITAALIAATLWRAGGLAQSERYQASQDADWIAACQWMRDHTSPGSVVHTPHFRWTFKWYAERAEYANYKDCPQDARSIVEWNRRLQLLTKRFQDGFADGVYTWDELQELRDETGITHIITDRLGPMDFPPVYRNDTFRVYDLVASPLP